MYAPSAEAQVSFMQCFVSIFGLVLLFSYFFFFFFPLVLSPSPNYVVVMQARSSATKTSAQTARVTKSFKRRRCWRFMSRRGCSTARRLYSKEKLMKP